MKYEGDFTDNKIEGKGKWEWPNGDIYEGSFYCYHVTIYFIKFSTY